MTHWNEVNASLDSSDLPIRKERRQSLFFAPAHIQKRIRDWGRGEYEKTDSFMKARVEQSNDWMNVREIEGLKGFAEVYRQIVEGDLDPSEGIIVKN